MFGLVGFYLAPSCAVCFCVFSFCLTHCFGGLLFAGCRFVVPIVFRVCPQWMRLVQSCVGFLVEGTGACVLVGGAGSCLSGGQGCI